MAEEVGEKLTWDEAVSYVKKNLEIANVEELLTSDPVKLLDRITSSFQERVPLQSILLHLEPLGKRRRPSWPVVKENVVAGFGGLCYELNVFMYILLKSLKYDVFLVKASVSRPDNHLITIARNVINEGDFCLIDAGCGFPTFTAINLTFKDESPIYNESFLQYKFVKTDGKILRMHRSRSLLPPKPDGEENYPVQEWKRFYDFELCPRTLYDIDLCFDHVFEDPMGTSSHTVLRCSMFPDQKVCGLRNNILFIENSNGELAPTEYDSDSDLLEAICERFPAFRKIRGKVEESVKCWRALPSSINSKTA